MGGIIRLHFVAYERTIVHRTNDIVYAAGGAWLYSHNDRGLGIGTTDRTCGTSGIRIEIRSLAEIIESRIQRYES
jgi:hypothetical protein